MQSLTFQDVAASLASHLDGVGFDVLGAVAVGAYNRMLAPHQDGFRLPQLRDECRHPLAAARELLGAALDLRRQDGH